jgi:hypothetical protein
VAPAWPAVGGSVAFAITGRANGSTGRDTFGTRGVSAVMTGTVRSGWPIGRAGSSAARSRCIARACSCDTRDSFTPSSSPISFIVTSPK